MISLSKEILSIVYSKYPELKSKKLKAYPILLYRNGYPQRVNIFYGTFNTTSEVGVMQILYDDKGNIVDEKTFNKLDYDRKYHEPSVDDIYSGYGPYVRHDLESDMVCFHKITEHLGTMDQDFEVNDFRYDTRGVLHRLPDVTTQYGSGDWIDDMEVHFNPYEFTDFEEQDFFKLKLWSKFQQIKKDVYDTIPPKNCPSYKVRDDWTKPIYKLTHRLLKKYLSTKWADGEQLNVFRYMAFKYSFKGEIKTYKQIANNWSVNAYQKDLKI